MKKQVLILFYFLSAVTVLLFSCKKENKKLGKYTVSVTYTTTAKSKPLQLEVFIDGVKSGELSVSPNATPTYLADCAALEAQQITRNVFVVKGVSAGKHRVELRNKSGGSYSPLQFEMLATECIFQDTNLSLN